MVRYYIGYKGRQLKEKNAHEAVFEGLPKKGGWGL